MKMRYLVLAPVALVAAACASDPYHSDASYSEPRFARVGPGSDAARYYGEPRYYSDSRFHSDVGRVVAIDVARGSDVSPGAGAVVGGIVGGVLGHQIGSGSGNDIATAAGAIGGAVAGHELAKRRSDDRYRVTVQFADGREATFHQDSLHGIRVGDRVRVSGDRLALY